MIWEKREVLPILRERQFSQAFGLLNGDSYQIELLFGIFFKQMKS
jgi:hypothetical protein